ncbi:MAG: 3-dehydroquinate synthase [Candidatus Acidiferrales bacterium]
MSTIRIASSAGPYDVLCARGSLARARALAEREGSPSGIFFVSSPRVWSHWGKRLAGKGRGRQSGGTILFDDSETEKRLATVERIARGLISLGADRHATLVAVGGGVVGDVAGFVAATYLRGVKLIHVPTTLVAQVDSAIGGKTGVNLPEGKNLVGAFYPPRLVISDPDALSTLPHRQYRSGLYEVIKYGVIADPTLFSYLERHMLALLRRDRPALERVILRCARIKAGVVVRDEREGGLRQILNFGHTLGHAIEAATGYRRFLHGEAIGWGMLAATLIGVALNRIRESDASRVLRLVMSVGPLPKLDGISAQELRSIIAGDKKARDGSARWVISPRIGKAEWGQEVPWTVVSRAFAEIPSIAQQASI